MMLGFPYVTLLLICAWGAAAGPGKLGASEDVATDSEEIASHALFAVGELNDRANFPTLVKLTKIVDARRQVVAGVLYYIDVEIGETSCERNEIPVDLVDCQLLDTPLMICSVKVWTKPWTGSRTMEEFKCDQASVYNSIPASSFRGAAVVDAVPDKAQGIKPDTMVDTVAQLNRAKVIQKRKEVKQLENRQLFETFINDFSKSYPTPDEKEWRYGIFVDNLNKIEKYNSMDEGTAVYGVTKFMDLSEEEFSKMYTPKQMMPSAPSPPLPTPENIISYAPDAYDWRDHGAVTAVKNQGSCGSCWAFSTTGNIEGQWFLQKGALISLSEQELVDCDKVDEGCEGGLPSLAYKEIMRIGGLESEADYPYKGRDDSCEFDKSKVVVYINDSLTISEDEGQMAAWLAQNGPISIGINAFAMQFYIGGISHPWKIFCNPKSLDHGVLIVGYGTESNEPYWIIKNSWGAEWGEKGYYRVYRGDGTCGLNTMCTSAVVS